MQPVAFELGKTYGVIEPFGTAYSVDGQIEELHGVLTAHAAFPVALIGWSWGAWLGVYYAARYPREVAKLILVSSGPFEAQYAKGIMATRLKRLSPAQRKSAEKLSRKLQNGKAGKSDFSEFGRYMDLADRYDALPDPHAGDLPADPRVYASVWPEADRLRESGALLKAAKTLTCPVVAIHGDWDPHPVRGVEKPLSRTLPDFRFLLLKHSGHTPWLERQATRAFFRLLHKEVAGTMKKGELWKP
ncbi:alpha/beta hydrolase [Patescibacteria group bacterium]|nr:alpha/beta hydrolase [Patescibacteria group bacterium]